MKHLTLLMFLCATLCGNNQTCVAAESLSQELAAERGQKLKKLDLLGASKSAPVKMEIMGCSGQPLANKMALANGAPGKGIRSGKDGIVSENQGLDGIDKMKESLMETSRQASNSRYQSAMATDGKKKSCNVKLFE